MRALHNALRAFLVRLSFYNVMLAKVSGAGYRPLNGTLKAQIDNHDVFAEFEHIDAMALTRVLLENLPHDRGVARWRHQS